MSLKQKCEAAALALIEADGLFTGQLLRSDENHEVTGIPPYVAAIYTPMSGRNNSKGQHTGQENGLLSVVARSHADRVEEVLEDPAARHAELLNQVRHALVVANFATALTAAAVQPYHCLRASSTRATLIAAKARMFQEIWTWEVHHVQVTCS